MNGIENQGDLLPAKEGDNNPLQSDATNNTKYNDLIAFISKAQEQNLNCLDLSKRNLKEFPSQLLELTTLQYLYLEGNQLTQLPSDLFLRLPHLKWLDLRNNQLISIPSDGLAKHRALQYLLLSGNRLRTLPSELGKVKTLSALNLDRNPLDHPPFTIIKQGIKSIQQYLRDQLNADASVSSDDDRQQQQTPTFSFHRPWTSTRKSKSEVSYYEASQANLLPAHLQSCIQYKRISYSVMRPSTAVRSRPQSVLKLPQMRTKIAMKNDKQSATDDFIIEKQQLMHLRHRNIPVDQEIQHSRQRSFITSQNFEQPIIHPPLHVDPHYTQPMNTDQQATIKYKSRGNHTNNEEERRMHDRQIQDRIRQITEQMLQRRVQARSSLFEDKRQVQLELRELRRLDSDVEKQYQSSYIDHHFKSRKKF